MCIAWNPHPKKYYVPHWNPKKNFGQKWNPNIFPEKNTHKIIKWLIPYKEIWGRYLLFVEMSFTVWQWCVNIVRLWVIVIYKKKKYQEVRDSIGKSTALVILKGHRSLLPWHVWMVVILCHLCGNKVRVQLVLLHQLTHLQPDIYVMVGPHTFYVHDLCFSSSPHSFYVHDLCFSCCPHSVYIRTSLLQVVIIVSISKPLFWILWRQSEYSQRYTQG